MANWHRVDEAAWPHILHDLKRFGATNGELTRVAEMVDAGLPEVAFSLVDATLQRLREECSDAR